MSVGSCVRILYGKSLCRTVHYGTEVHLVLFDLCLLELTTVVHLFPCLLNGPGGRFSSPLQCDTPL